MKYPSDKDRRCTVVLEYSPKDKKAFVRGVVEQGTYLKPLEPENTQNHIDCFFGLDHEHHVGISPLVVEKE